MMFEFKPLAADDFPLMLKWLSKEHVREWWNDGDDTLEKVALHYGEKDDAARFILLETDKGEKKPIGYFKYYFETDGSIGIDQFIGEEDPFESRHRRAGNRKVCRDDYPPAPTDTDFPRPFTGK